MGRRGVGQDGDDSTIVGVAKRLEGRTCEQLVLGKLLGAQAVGILRQGSLAGQLSAQYHAAMPPPPDPFSRHHDSKGGQ
jgi:hypothetical protein